MTPTLSLCMIVRNEAPRLARCLDSVKDLVSEIILVDTGSTDTTLEIARQYTDKIFHYTWQDDFATARNESLRHATGDWILVLDADEVMPPETKERLPQFLHKAQEQTHPIILNFAVTQGQTINFKRACFPNHRQIYFVRPVHEVLSSSTPLIKWNCHELTIWHELPSLALQQHKAERYLQHLKRYLAQPNLPAEEQAEVYKHMAEAWEILGEPAKALTAYQTSRQSLETQLDHASDPFYWHVLSRILALMQTLQYVRQELAEPAQRLTQVAPHFRLGWLLAAEVALWSEQWQEAEQSYQRVVNLSQEIGKIDFEGILGLARLKALQGYYQEARLILEPMASKAKIPKDWQIHLSRFCLLAQDLPAALRWLQKASGEDFKNATRLKQALKAYSFWSPQERKSL